MVETGTCEQTESAMVERRAAVRGECRRAGETAAGSIARRTGCAVRLTH